MAITPVLNRILIVVLLVAFLTLMLRFVSTELPKSLRNTLYRKPAYTLQLAKSRLIDDPSLGPITSLEAITGKGRAELIAAGSNGALYLSRSGAVVDRVRFQVSGPGARAIDSDGDGRFIFFLPGFGSDIALLREDGSVRWALAGEGRYNRYAVGDVNQDMGIEVVLIDWAKGEDGIRVISEDGTRQWEQTPDGRLFSRIACRDIRWQAACCVGGNLSDIESTDGGSSGRLIPFDTSTFSLIKWPSSDTPVKILITDRGVLWIDHPRKDSLIRFHVPDEYRDYRHVYGTAVRLQQNKQPYLAALFIGAKSTLVIYDPRGAVVFEEPLNDRCDSILAIPNDRSPEEDLLIGGSSGVVWRYTLNGIIPTGKLWR